MLSLTEDKVVKELELTDEQKEKIQGLLKDRETQLAEAKPSQRSITLAYWERKLAAALTPEQKAKWDTLAGLQKGETAPVPGATAKTDDDKEEDPKVAEGTTRPSGVGSTKRPAKQEGEATAPVRYKVSPDGKIRFSFRAAPWKEVLDWFAAQADLSLDADTVPPGSVNYTDSKAYTTGEALDVLNGMLLTKGYTLVRRGRLLMVVNLEDAPPFDRLVTRIDPKDLDEYGEFELVGCLFQLDKFAPEDAETEIKKLIGPQGSIIVMPKARQIFVTETAGKLRTIRQIIERVENPEIDRDGQLTEIMLKHVDVETVMATLRPLIGIPDERFATPDGSVKIVPDDAAGRLIVEAKPDRITKIKEIIKLVDIPSLADDEPSLPEEPPSLAVYKLGGLDPNVVLPVMQTLLADLPNVRLAIDQKANSLIAQAPPKQHGTIRDTLAQMQKDKNQFDVITLHKIDPQLAVLTINKMFGSGEGGDPNAPKVDADPTTRQLIVRGSGEQIEAIRTLLEKMGEDGSDELADAEKGPVRMIHASGSHSRAALDQMEAFWPTVRGNRLRIVRPSSASSSGRPREMRVPREDEKVQEKEDPLDYLRQFESLPPRRPAATEKPAATDEKPATRSSLPAESKSTQSRRVRVPVRFAAYQAPAKDEEPAETPKKEQEPSVPGAEIIVTVGPSGIIIASKDLEALDEFESMLRELLAQAPAAGAEEFTIIYLKFAKAEVAAALLQEILGAGGGESGGGGGGGGLLGNIASMALGGGGGGGGGDLIGGLLGLGGDDGGSGGGTIQTSGKVTVIPDPRLNALVVQAGPSDLELIEQLLKVIDQEFSPEDPQTQPIPRMIPVEYVTADEVAAIVREVYASRIAPSAGSQQRQQPSPEEFIRALRGGGRGGRGGGGNDRQRGEETKMTVGVDKRSNSLIVSAPDPLFREVEALVRQIDQAGTETDEVTQVVQLKSGSPELVRNALSAHLGPKATINTATTTGGTQQATQGGQVAGNQQGNRGQGQGQGRRGGGGQRGGAQGGQDLNNIFQAIQAAQGGGGRGNRGGGQGGGGRTGGGGGRGR